VSETLLQSEHGFCAGSRFCLVLDPLQLMSTLCSTHWQETVSGLACLHTLVQVAVPNFLTLKLKSRQKTVIKKVWHMH